jgi:hypothetical protein
VRALGVDRASYRPSPDATVAVDRLLAAAKELRPSAVKFYVDESSAGGQDLAARLGERIRVAKAKAEVALVASATKALLKERQIVTGDAETLDACAGWFNLVGRLAIAIPGAKIVKLQ